MDHRNAKVYYAKRGEYVTLDGATYVGSFYSKSSGILMTTPLDSSGNLSKSQVIVPVRGRKAKLSPPIDQPLLNTDLDENKTEYDLLPVIYNDPPIIIAAMSEASQPQIKPSAAAANLTGDYMYQFPDGAVKVHTGTTIVLQVDAEQPPVFNVENGVLEIIDADVGLVYTWLVDGERVPENESVPSLRSSRVMEGNKVIITNMIPRFAGNYTCLVSNDIGSSDGGTVLLDVYNSDVDSFFYTNLIKNPNGTLEDGSLGVSGWTTLNGAMTPKGFTAKTIGSRDKKIEIDQMSPIFHWTKEMMSPRPYQLDGGILQKDPLKKLKSYFTRDKYQYELNGGVGVAQMYQDIDLKDLTDHIKGSIYGISGISAVVSFYLGNALWTYEPASPYLRPPHAIDPALYNQGSSRISLENFALMGPGFVREDVRVTIEEYIDNQILPQSNNKASVIVKDPWNQRLGQYSNKIYYPGGRGHLIAPDAPSQGDDRDRHLFVADELMPNQDDRYTYGQYAEFKKVVIPKLNPKTNKIRVLFSIEATRNLMGIIESTSKWEAPATSDGLFYVKDWKGGWSSGNMDKPDYDMPWDSTHKPWNNIKKYYRTGESWPEHIEQRVPKQSTSRALATGFNVTLVPDESDRGVDNSNNIVSMQSRNTSVKGIIPSPIDENLAGTVYDALDDGGRYLDIFFGMTADGVIGTRIKSSKSGEGRNFSTTLGWSPGLLPFAWNTETEYIAFPKVESITEGTFIQIPPYKVGTIPQTNGYTLPPYLKTFPTDKVSENSPSYSYVQLTNGLFDNGNENTAPSYPKDWYTIAAPDRLRIFQDIERNIIDNTTSASESLIQKTELSYSNWATPEAPMHLNSYVDTWNSSQQAFQTTATINTTQWRLQSRFIITIGVHNTNYGDSDVNSLHSMQSYYMDITGNKIILHKTKNLGKAAFLPSFNELEEATTNQLQLLRSNNTQADGVKFDNADRDEDGGVTGEFDLYTTEQRDMEPVTMDVEQVLGDVGTSQSYTKVTLPTYLQGATLDKGGLNIPVTIDITLPNQNIVTATISLLTKYQGQIPDSILTTNRANATAAIDAQIAERLQALKTRSPGLDAAKTRTKNWINAFQSIALPINKYPWGNSEDLPPAAAIAQFQASVADGSLARYSGGVGDEFDFMTSVAGTNADIWAQYMRQLLERRIEDLGDHGRDVFEFLHLYWRKNIIDEIYARLLSRDPILTNGNDLMQLLTLPNSVGGSGGTNSDSVLNLYNQRPTLTDMFTDDSLGLDPNYKTILYGVRPAPISQQIDFSQEIIDTSRFTGTPLSGEDANGFNTYVVRDIIVVNK